MFFLDRVSIPVNVPSASDPENLAVSIVVIALVTVAVALLVYFTMKKK